MKTLLRASWLFVLLAGAGLSTAEAMVNPLKAQNAIAMQGKGIPAGSPERVPASM